MNISDELLNNRRLFDGLLNPIDDNHIYFKQTPKKWNLLEVACHLLDEEKMDFRYRIKWLFENPEQIPPPFNPLDWINDHDYANQDLKNIKQQFLAERDNSIKFLKKHENAPWSNGFDHPKLGRLTASYFLDNWLAHDYLHIKQLLKLQFDYLNLLSSHDLDYAGNW